MLLYNNVIVIILCESYREERQIAMEQLICKGTPAKVSESMFGAITALASISGILA
jgi:hypothetical protein